MDKENELIIESIKLAVRTTSYLGFPIKDIYESTIIRLNGYYEETSEKCYLEAALLHIQAYIEMGLQYEDLAELFDNILEKLGVDRKTIFSREYYYSKAIKPTKSQIRSMFYKWPASKYRINLDEVVNEIKWKIENKEIGIHYYNSNPNPDNLRTSGGDLYELVINNHEIYFHDIKRRRYFTILS